MHVLRANLLPLPHLTSAITPEYDIFTSIPMSKYYNLISM